MWNYNIGNITSTGKDQFNYINSLKTNEQISPGKWKKMYLKYRAYNSLKEGALDFLKFLSSNKRYTNAWKHIINPNPELYSKSLKSSGYYTANEPAYTKGLKSLFKRFNKSDAYELAQNKGKSIDYNVENITDIYKQLVAENKITKNLPENKIKIAVKSNDIIDNIEFAKILSMALDEELFTDSFVHTNGKNVEVECKINGFKESSYNIIKQFTEVVQQNFNDIIKNNIINTNIIFNSKSKYEPITLEAQESNDRKFLIKRVKG